MIKNESEKEPKVSAVFIVGNNTLNQKYDYTTDLIFEKSKNISTYEVYINGSFFGNDPNKIQINTGDNLTLTITKKDNNEESSITFMSIVI